VPNGLLFRVKGILTLFEPLESRHALIGFRLVILAREFLCQCQPRLAKPGIVGDPGSF
jgi:hypothetical protein